jgi:hypothetical protein
MDQVLAMMAGLDPDIGEDIEGDFTYAGRKLLLKIVDMSDDAVTLPHLQKMIA